MNLLGFAVGLLFLAQAQPSGPAPLRIVVLEGEDAVNVVQQKTAVRPLVEVRDRNNLPVAGATVTFTIGSGQPAAFAGGVQTLTVTTNAAGQAAAASVTPLGPGAVQIQVQAAFQGQVATGTIAQTNVAAAAAAGGGISATTIALIGAAAGGGALAAQRAGVLGGFDEYSGSFKGQLQDIWRFVEGRTCIHTHDVEVTLIIRIEGDHGRMELTGTNREVGVTAGCQPIPTPLIPLHAAVEANNPPSNLNFHSENSGTNTQPDGSTGTTTVAFTFTGSVSGETITGVLTYATTGRAAIVNSDGLTTIQVTLRK